MPIEKIARKTPGLKRHYVKEIREEEGQLLIYPVPDRRYELICSQCGAKGPGYDTLNERKLFGFHRNTVRRVVKDVVDYGLKHREMSDLLYIGIDGISRRKGHIYHTQVYDLFEKRLLGSGEDRTAETLDGFCDELGKEGCEQIEAICCDIWAPHVDVIKARFPNALLVFDKFHFVRRRIFSVLDYMRLRLVCQGRCEHMMW